MFWDPNVYGRYLALVIVVVTAALLWAKERRDFWLLAGSCRGPLARPGADLLAVELHRPAGRAGGAGGAALELALDAWRRSSSASSARSSSSPWSAARRSTLDRLNIDTSGRANLVSGGLDLFGERPLWGYGSGSFQHAYGDHRDNKDLPVSVSHTEPVTVAAEQGLLGFALYVALIVVPAACCGR